MKRKITHSIKKWFLLVLFASYVSGISFFTHKHTVNHVVYVHSHPYKKGANDKHTHTQNELHILDLFYHTTITDEVVPEIDLADHSLPDAIVYRNLYESFLTRGKKGTVLLRAPPAA